MVRAQLTRPCFATFFVVGFLGCGDASTPGADWGEDAAPAVDVALSDGGVSVDADGSQGLVGKDDVQGQDAVEPPADGDAVVSRGGGEDAGPLVDALPPQPDVAGDVDAVPAEADGVPAPDVEAADVAPMPDVTVPDSGISEPDGEEGADAQGPVGDDTTGGGEPPQESTCPAPSGLQPGAAWPMRSACPNHHGRSVHSGPATATIAWSVELGPSHQQPVIDAEGRIYVADDLGTLHAVSSEGVVVWTNSLLSMGGGTAYTALTTPLLAATGELIIGTADGFVHAVDPSGEIVWSVATGGAVTGDPAISPDGTIVVATDTGTVRWISSDGFEIGFNFITLGIDAAPAMADHDSVFFGPVDTLVRRIGLSTGLAWSAGVGTASHQAVAIADTGFVYAAGHYGASPFGEKHTELQAIHPTTGTVMWSAGIGNLTPRSPVIGLDGMIHVPVSRGHQFVYCALVTVTPEGEVIWAYEINDYCGGDAVVDSKGAVYMVSEVGQVAAVAADGQLVWSHTFDETGAMSLALGASGQLYVMQSAETGMLVAFSQGP